MYNKACFNDLCYDYVIIHLTMFFNLCFMNFNTLSDDWRNPMLIAHRNNGY